MKNNRPFLKWAGGKYRYLEQVLPSLPKAHRLIEPFTGSGAIFLNTDHQEYLLAEHNHDLIQIYQHLQQEGESFITFCKTLYTPVNNSQEAYYHLREKFNHCKDKRERAALFLYLNRHGYNGLCRYNKSGIYNVPFGRYSRPYFPQEEMRFFHQKSQRATFVQADFQATFKNAKPGDIVYCDPPYAPLAQISNFSAYTDSPFGEPEQILLAKLAKKAAKQGITVVISNHDTKFTRKLYQSAEITSFRVSRYISRDINERNAVFELLAVFRARRKSQEM